MVDITVTAANVAGTTSGTGTAGVAITAGDVVARSGGELILADADAGADADAVQRKAVGVALNDAADGQPVAYAGPGAEITAGATLTAGTVYYLSATAGGICPVADVGSGMNPVVVGIATSTSKMKLLLVNSGVELA